MLIEADKRGPDFAVPLIYRNESEAAFFVPPNLYLIGLMNLADRSLAMVDYALRRRFVFVTLKPQYGSELFRQWLQERGMHADLVRLDHGTHGAAKPGDQRGSAARRKLPDRPQFLHPQR